MNDHPTGLVDPDNGTPGPSRRDLLHGVGAAAFVLAFAMPVRAGMLADDGVKQPIGSPVAAPRSSAN